MYRFCAFNLNLFPSNMSTVFTYIWPLIKSRICVIFAETSRTLTLISWVVSPRLEMDLLFSQEIYQCTSLRILSLHIMMYFGFKFFWKCYSSYIFFLKFSLHFHIFEALLFLTSCSYELLYKTLFLLSLTFHYFARQKLLMKIRFKKLLKGTIVNIMKYFELDGQ